MRSVARLGRGMAIALALAAGGCAVGDGTGLLVLSISFDDSVPTGAASKLVLSLPGVSDRSYPGAFPPADRAPLVLQFPNLPASSGPVTASVRAFDASGCLVAQATKPVTVQGGAKTVADIVLTKSSNTCTDAGGVPDGAVDGIQGGDLRADLGTCGPPCV